MTKEENNINMYRRVIDIINSLKYYFQTISYCELRYTIFVTLIYWKKTTVIIR